MSSLIDSYPTHTSEEQALTEHILASHRPPPGESKPTLQRRTHWEYLLRNLQQGFPERFTSQDASQPWLVYWTTHSCYLLGGMLDEDLKQRAIDSIMAFQHPDGGFGGGPGQAPHLLPTYAAVSALAVVGRPGPRGGWDQIDRAKLYAFFMSLKQPDGSFLVSNHSEVDIRGTYCLLCVATLLNLLTPEILAGTARFVASLQTYEGGFASASQPYFASTPPTLDSLLESPRPPLGEAHGGYTFCALASWVILRPLLSHIATAEPAGGTVIDIDTKRLARWLAHMQGSEVELGGFRGRTNKLVDVCYSWWVGGAFALLRPLGVGASTLHDTPESGEDKGVDDSWTDVDESLFNRLGLQEYVLYAGQHQAGGLRDKPPKHPDAYHTLYALAGLASAQHTVLQVDEKREALRAAWKSDPDEKPALDELRKTAYAEARSWTEEEGGSAYVNGKGDRVNAVHPVFNLTITHATGMLKHFYQQE